MKIIVYEKVWNFIGKLEKVTQAKVIRDIELLEEYGYKLTCPYTKKLGSDLFELRTRGVQEVRLLYTFKQQYIYIVSGFIKKTQKTPQNELEKAIKLIKTIDI